MEAEFTGRSDPMRNLLLDAMANNFAPETTDVVTWITST
jgi:hypothetical protein